MQRARSLAASVAVLALATQGCAAQPKRLAYSPDELRRDLAHRIPPGEVVVPFEITAEHVARARELTQGTTDPAEKVRILVDAMFSRRVFGLRYLVGVPGTAEEAFRHGGGDCLALSSVFIGLARSVGLDADYMDASFRVVETEYLGDQTTVKVGHITAFVSTPTGRLGLDFARMGRVDWYEPIDDVEAVAHFHNNLGYLLLEGGGEGGTPADWEAASHQFELATRVKPEFARAWNNLGVARARLGHRPEARTAYRRAMELDPLFSSPRLNLGAMLLDEGEAERALDVLETAARLDPKAPHVQYELGMARLKTGDRDGAVQALEKAVSLHGGWPAAQAVLDRLGAGGRTHREDG
ncbi:MAG TPA: tetratricopeptide repeat protein [Anaeromyxobacter sp.]|nr:tetratricopeptide repeat protein [Anaeromyxobacter sp.]